MPSNDADLQPISNISPHNSSTPLITTEQRDSLRHAEPSDEKSGKSLKQRILGLGKKKEDAKESSNMSNPVTESTAEQVSVSSGLPLTQQQQAADTKPKAQLNPLLPTRLPGKPDVAASPSRLRSSSPRLHSPASSEIFERSVQEPIPISGLGSELSNEHIPAHVITEDSIPPALEASAQAITSETLNPDEVEIVMSASHQPAAAAVLEGSASQADLTSLNSPLRNVASADSEHASSSLHASGLLPGTEDDGASNYGQLDPNDVRRLSFISFKDVVQSEHQHLAPTDRDNLHMSNMTTSSLSERAASPLRSPRSPTSPQSSIGGGMTTPPPPGVNVTHSNADQSPVRSIGLGSPGSTQHGELTIETMRQSIRKTASGDLGAARHGSEAGLRSTGMSPVTDENPSFRDQTAAARKGTNT